MNELASFIINYISERKQPKLDAFDKEAAKKLSELVEEDRIGMQQTLAIERQELEQRYEVTTWLTDAAKRAGQISLVTHALKFTHSDAKGSSVFNQQQVQPQSSYLSTATLHKPAVDAVGNAAALDVAKLLQMEVNGDSLLASLQRNDHSALAILAIAPEQLALWVEGFSQALTDKQLSSHQLAKQLYFPVGPDQYHLISPLFSSSLEQALQQRISQARFSDSSKATYQAVKDNRWHPDTRVIFPDLAVQNMGGTKPQNISYLNSARGGKAYLLNCAAPAWQSQQRPPLNTSSIFKDNGSFSYLARSVVRQLKQFLLSVQPLENNREIKRQRLIYCDEIIDVLFNYVAGIQNLTDFGAWSTREDCQLPPSQQLWLDTTRLSLDGAFNQHYGSGDWQKEIAADFSRWFNRQLQHQEIVLGAVEAGEWRALLRRRLRDFVLPIPEVNAL